MRRRIKSRVKHKGTIADKKTNIRTSRLNKDKNSKRVQEKINQKLDPINYEVYSPIKISADSNQNGDCSFKLSSDDLNKVNNLFSVLSNKLEKNLVFEISRDSVLKVTQEQEGVTALGYLDIELIEPPRKLMMFVISKDVIKSLAEVVVDYALVTIKDAQLQILIQETDLELSTIETSEISSINIDLQDYQDYEYLNADIVMSKFSRARNIQVASAGTFEATVRLDNSIHIGSTFYLSEIKDVFKKFEANISPHFLTHILNLAKYAHKSLKFSKNKDYFLVCNDIGMMYRTAINHIEFPTNLSKEYLPEVKKLSVANFDSRVLTTSIAKLQIALFGVASPVITVKFNPRRLQADVFVKALNNKKSTDSWRAGVMDKAKVPEFKVLLDLLKNSISILNNDIKIEIYEDFIVVRDEEQLILVSVSEE